MFVLRSRHWDEALPVAVVTGSNGKTTVKEMLAAIMRVAFGDDYLATRGNLNNDIGLPLTLLDMRKNHRAAVIELGEKNPGDDVGECVSFELIPLVPLHDVREVRGTLADRLVPGAAGSSMDRISSRIRA